MLSQGNEILTLAVGHYSSHLATNFFNIQEASFSYNPNFSSGINHDISFRENFRRASSLTPRLILIDDEDSLGYLSREGCYQNNFEDALNGEQEDQSVVHTQPKWDKNNYITDLLKEKERLKSNTECQDFLLKASYNLEESIKSWSDYVVTEFDEHTILTLPKHTEYYVDNENFTCFDAGHTLWHNTSLCDDTEERIRYFLEECDNLQGFQLLIDGGNGYSGISAGCVELLKDEYPKKTMLSIPSIFLDTTLQEDVKVRNKKRCDRLYSLASSFSSYSEYCDLIAPMSHLFNPWGKEPSIRKFRNLNYKQDKMYYTSAVLASAFDLFSMPFRIQNTKTSMNNYSSTLNIFGRSFLTVGISLPFPVQRYEGSFPSLEQMGGRFFESLTPLIDVDPEHIDIQSISTRGLGKIPTRVAGVNLHVMERDFKTYLHQNFPHVISHFSPCKSVFRVPRTYPSMLNNDFNLVKGNTEFGPLSEFVAVGGLHNTKEMHFVLNNLYEEARNIKKKGLAGFRPRDSDIDYDSFFECLKNTSDSYLDTTYI